MTATRPFELGLYSFVEWTAHSHNGKQISPTERIANYVCELVV